MTKAKNMIDLKKLEAKFDTLFENETQDSFDKWLREKKMKKVFSFFGEGHIYSFDSPLLHSEIKPSNSMQFEFQENEQSSDLVKANNKYTIAA